jgi:uncharacterized cupredoxin-like copper-binding protein
MTQESSMKRRTMIMVGVAAALAPWQAGAHGDGRHAAKQVKEQKPWGIAGERSAAKRSIEVGMGDDMRFRPARIQARLGETVRFVIRNRGQVMHEFVIGTRPELDAHAAMMLKFPDMEHDEPYMAHVPPGRTAEIVWTFNRAGDFDFACLIAGHYQAGMTGTIQVAAR